MKLYNFPQGSQEWHDARAGIPTASDMHVLFTAACELPKKTTQGMLTYAAELAADLSAGYALGIEEDGESWAMRRGKELESDARERYRFVANDIVTEVGFITDDEGTVGCSPDSLVGERGLLEIKCPLRKAFMKAALDISQGIVPLDYYVQIQAQLWITERDWCDLFLYHPVLGSVRIRCYPEKGFHEKLEKQCALIATERDKFVEALAA